ncbi:Bcr/CflA family multidrug efflux MFS transporter [Pantoea cypripedii]|uniref:Bcr/CflA family efflux transporter n=1 Tax=Pantoea cypripedii TaxID=55209 RepID=A0A6B9FZY5_PANCY|nr:Bcr/CflA family multidrug efflux MFS transporter [Pantoea cypripedii]QGY29922.1 Bcr/CflA family drug resistance efflux transporter [Pantoea cypripedii]
MPKEKNSPVGLVVILGLLAMLMPLSIDMYLPAMPQIARQFAVSSGSVQMTLNLYILGFAIGQLVYGPLADSYGRKPVIALGTLIFACAAAACALSQSIDQLIFMRFLHGLSAAAASVVINALMRDSYSKEEFSRMMSFVMLITTIAPLLAPIIGGWLLLLWSWHAIFWTLSIAAVVTTVLVVTQIRETLKPEQRQRFHLRTTLGNFVALVRHKRAFSYMLASGFSFAGLFAFLNAGPFVYIEVNHVSPQNFGYYFGLNVVFLFVMTLINSRAVRRFGPLAMFRIGLVIQFCMGVWLLVASALNLGFLPLVLGVAMFIGCVSTVSSNAMAVILDEFPHMAGTASSLAGTLRFGVGALVGALLSMVNVSSAWPMVATIALCATVSIVLFSYAARPRHNIA